jgi:hypothetical protein
MRITITVIFLVSEGVCQRMNFFNVHSYLVTTELTPAIWAGVSFNDSLPGALKAPIRHIDSDSLSAFFAEFIFNLAIDGHGSISFRVLDLLVVHPFFPGPHTVSGVTSRAMIPTDEQDDDAYYDQRQNAN